jgi:tyrosinase
MQVGIEINNSSSSNARYVTWAPSGCRIRVTNPVGLIGPQAQVTLSRVVSAAGGSIEFSKTATGPFSASLILGVPKNGSSVNFFVRGVFGRPSSSDGDVRIEAKAKPNPFVAVSKVGQVSLMVRVRKDAMALSAQERSRLLAAFATLNNQGLGRFTDFRDMHVNQSSAEAHGRPGFLPWHRAYLLDLERELQAIDPSVSLPYWRFDKPAAAIFTKDYLGESDASGNVQFSPTNPLQFWRTDNMPGILRRPLFNTNQAPGVRTEAQTLALGTQFSAFRMLEGNPHGSAHTSFGGFISGIGSAARDPLFFLLHCNVDRLWAKWQKNNGRFDTANAASFDTNNPGNRVGHNLPDSMWPWNGVINTGGRPPFAPGGALASSPCVGAPGPQPLVSACFDYQGAVNSALQLGFSYDDVP